VKNLGTSAVTPSVQMVSEKSNTSDAGTASIAAGATQEIVVPFAPAKAWTGAPSSTIFKGELSGEKTGSPDVQPGTGTRYASDRTDWIKLTAAHDGPASLLIESIMADAPVAEIPEWLGTRPPVEGEWEKTFDDDFTGTQIDLTKWNNEGPNYWDKISHWSKENVVVDGKTVKLHYEKKTGFQNDDPKGKQSDFTGGYLDTFGKFSQRYGYFEARMKLPIAPGLWPAFWMMPDRGEAAGEQWKRASTDKDGMEFDIMEFLSGWGVHRYNIAMHWDGYGKNHKATGNEHIYVQTDKDGFITCGLLWEPGKVTYYANGQPVLSWSDPRISTVQGDLMFTLPMGGWDNAPLDPKQLPDDFVIDYVRCWQRADMASK